MLELDSSIKNRENGFIDYYLERKSKLAQLKSGNIIIKMNYSILEKNNDGLLTISITDSGQGFNYQKKHTPLTKNKQSYGRGIELVKNLCQNIDFQDDGRTIIARYIVDRSRYRIIK